MAVRLSGKPILVAALALALTIAPGAGHCGGRSASASFSVGLRLQPTGGAPLAPVAWTAPAQTRLLASAANTQFRLSNDALPGTVARYRAQLEAQGFVLDSEAGDEGGWTAQWRGRDGRCLAIRARPVSGIRAVRVEERAVACGT